MAGELAICSIVQGQLTAVNRRKFKRRTTEKNIPYPKANQTHEADATEVDARDLTLALEHAAGL